jgi:hypothetical protein
MLRLIARKKNGKHRSVLSESNQQITVPSTTETDQPLPAKSSQSAIKNLRTVEVVPSSIRAAFVLQFCLYVGDNCPSCELAL